MDDFETERSRKVREAKQAFSDREMQENGAETRHSGFMFRFFVAGMLFLLCILGLNAGVFGWDKEQILQLLSNEEYWEQLLQKVGDYAQQILRQP